MFVSPLAKYSVEQVFSELHLSRFEFEIYIHA